MATIGNGNSNDPTPAEARELLKKLLTETPEEFFALLERFVDNVVGSNMNQIYRQLESVPQHVHVGEKIYRPNDGGIKTGLCASQPIGLRGTSGRDRIGEIRHLVHVAQRLTQQIEAEDCQSESCG